MHWWYKLQSVAVVSLLNIFFFQTSELDFSKLAFLAHNHLCFLRIESLILPEVPINTNGQLYFYEIETFNYIDMFCKHTYRLMYTSVPNIPTHCHTLMHIILFHLQVEKWGAAK